MQERDYFHFVGHAEAQAVNRQYGLDPVDGCKAGEWWFTITAEEGPCGVWTPHVVRVVRQGVGEREVPTELRRGSAFAAECAGPDPESARSALLMYCSSA